VEDKKKAEQTKETLKENISENQKSIDTNKPDNGTEKEDLFESPLEIGPETALMW
jgi:hypothetical protein